MYIASGRADKIARIREWSKERHTEYAATRAASQHHSQPHTSVIARCFSEGRSSNMCVGVGVSFGIFRRSATRSRCTLSRGTRLVCSRTWTPSWPLRAVITRWTSPGKHKPFTSTVGQGVSPHHHSHHRPSPPLAHQVEISGACATQPQDLAARLGGLSEILTGSMSTSNALSARGWAHTHHIFIL